MTSLATTDLVEFMRLPAVVQAEIESWQNAFLRIAPPVVKALRELATQRGASHQTAIRKYYAWKASGWRGLINRSRVPEDRGLAPELVEYWKTLCEQNGRKCRPAYRKLCREFFDGALIPGIPAGTPRDILPQGLSYENLLRFKPTKLELAAARVGRSAAASFRPKLFTTRKDLVVGQYYVFDDLWHDFKIAVIGQRRPARLLQLHTIDLLSGCQFARGLKPRIEDPESGQSVGLNSDEMLFFLAMVLSQYGYHPDGCTLMVEHGTAAISSDVERSLIELTNGKITVDRSGIEGASAFAGQYCGRSKGNFRFKASLESLGNLIHNETADITLFPGQTGSNSRINLPEELHGRERHQDALVLAIAALPSHIAQQLRLPFIESNQAKLIVDEISERINQRTDHELEGWLELGLTCVDMHVPGVGLIPASNYLALPPDKRAAVDAVASPVPRKLSPREVFDSGRKNLVRLRPEQTAALLKQNHGREVTVSHDGLIHLEDIDISPETLHFLAHHFAPGDKFLAVVNPWQPDCLHLFNSKGGWVGQVEAWQRVSRLDKDALHAQMGRAAKIERELLAPLARRGASITRQRLEDARHNAALIRSTGAQTAPASSYQPVDLITSPEPEEDTTEDPFNATKLL